MVQNGRSISLHKFVVQYVHDFVVSVVYEWIDFKFNNSSLVLWWNFFLKCAVSFKGGWGIFQCFMSWPFLGLQRTWPGNVGYFMKSDMLEVVDILAVTIHVTVIFWLRVDESMWNLTVGWDELESNVLFSAEFSERF